MENQEKISRRAVLLASEVARSSALASQANADQALQAVAQLRLAVRELSAIVEAECARSRRRGLSLWSRMKWVLFGD